MVRWATWWGPHQREFTKTAKSQQLGFFKAKREDFLDQGGVVQPEGVRRRLVDGPRTGGF